MGHMLTFYGFLGWERIQTVYYHVNTGGQELI